MEHSDALFFFLSSLFKSSAHFSMGLSDFFFLLIFFLGFLYILCFGCESFVGYMNCKYLFRLGLAFPLEACLLMSAVFSFNAVPFVKVFLCAWWFLCPRQDVT